MSNKCNSYTSSIQKLQWAAVSVCAY